jgi:branched-chain amino acid transport system permease protein
MEIRRLGLRRCCFWRWWRLRPFMRGSIRSSLMTSILMYMVIAVSWTFFSGPTGYISLASAAFFGSGIYTSAIFGMVLPCPW